MDYRLIEELKVVWYELQEYLKAKQYAEAADYIKQFVNDEIADVNYLKTILIITKDFKEHPIVGPVRSDLYRKYYNYMINTSDQHPNFHLYNPHPDDN